MKATLPGLQKGGRLKKVTLRGDHYAIGLQLGQRLKGLRFEEYSPELLRFSQRCRDLVREIYPPLLEKAEGLIVGGKLDRERFEILYFARGVQIKACAGFALAPHVTKHGSPLIGRNYHWAYAAWKWCEAREVHTQDVFSTLGYTHHWAGCPDVLNSKGLFLSLFGLPYPARRSPGLQWHMIMDMVAETCQNAKEAEALITSLSHLRSFGYLIADRNGEMTVVEVTQDEVNVRRPEDGFIVMTNHCVRQEDGDVPDRESVAMYRRIVEMITHHLPKVDEDVVKEILADHQGGICTGSHEGPYGEDDNQWGTIYALICRPRQLELSIAPGHPCRTPYYSVRLRTKTKGGHNAAKKYNY